MEETEEMVKPVSRRLGWLDIPICVLGFAQHVAVDAVNMLSDVIMLTASHANYLRDEREFKEIVKHYDDPDRFGAGRPESQD